MNKSLSLIPILLFLSFSNAFSQQTNLGDLDSLKREIIKLQLDVENVELSLQESKKTLKTGIFIATLGYTITIIGGQLLSTEPELGEALLYTGGAIGIGGTIVLVNGFNKLDLRIKK